MLFLKEFLRNVQNEIDAYFISSSIRLAKELDNDLFFGRIAAKKNIEKQFHFYSKEQALKEELVDALNLERAAHRDFFKVGQNDFFK